MSKQPIVMQGIPATSPYYDRLRSLYIQIDFAPYASPEYYYLSRLIEELEQRALRHMEIARRVEFLDMKI